MANTVLTHQMLAREAAAMLSEEGNFISNINRGRDGEFSETINGYKKGDFVDIGVPPVPVVFDGATFAGGGSAPDATETKVRLQLATQKHVPLTFTAKEKALNISDFKKRFLRPAMQSLASIVEADLMLQFKNAIPGLTGTAGSVPTAMTPFSSARGVMNRFMSPMGDRTALISSDANAGLVDASKSLFHAADEVEDQYLTGAIGEAQGYMFYENQSLPNHTNGTQASWTVNGAGQTGTTLNIGGLTASQTITKGTVFTIAATRAVHPITGVAYPSANLRQFVVTADFTASGTTGSISIYPAITPTSSTVVGTVNASPAAGAACTPVGAASTSYRQNLCFHKDAFAAAFAPLPILASCEGYTATVNGFSVRVMTFGNGQTDTESTRVDVLYGSVAVRPDHACRVTE